MVTTVLYMLQTLQLSLARCNLPADSHTASILQGAQLVDKLPELLSVVQESNTALQWLMLHSAGPQLSKVSTAVAKQNVDRVKLCRLMLDAAYLVQEVMHSLAACIAVCAVFCAVVDPHTEVMLSRHCFPDMTPVSGKYNQANFSIGCVSQQKRASAWRPCSILHLRYVLSSTVIMICFGPLCFRALDQEVSRSCLIGA